jgi:biopolymer transport protein ExbD
MKLRRPAPRTERESVVALIDVTFFLLVFFMMVGRLDATAPFSVLPPNGQTGTDLPGGGMTLSVGTQGALALDGAPLENAALEATIKARLSTNPTALLRINADRATPLRIILGLVNRLEDAGAKDVAIIVSPEVQ